MSYRFMDGSLVNGPVMVEPYTEVKTADVIIQRGTYQCAACGGMLQFEPCDIVKDHFAVGYCVRGHGCDDPALASNCSMWKVRVKIPLERIQCEVLA